VACLNANVADLSLVRQMNVAKPDPGQFFACDDKFAFTAPVGRFQANAFGLSDMLGNVWQWTSDCWHDNYKQPPPLDGSPWNTTGDCGRRVLRGGSWIDDPWVVRAGLRDWYDTGGRLTYAGLRVARTH
jgi:formylglycine-generating enzyme required for sulfatase activity